MPLHQPTFGSDLPIPGHRVPNAAYEMRQDERVPVQESDAARALHRLNG